MTKQLPGISKADVEACSEISKRKKFEVNKLIAERDALKKSLGVIQKVLDYATYSDATRYKMLCWVKDAIDKMLRNENVEEPERVKP